MAYSFLDKTARAIDLEWIYTMDPGAHAAAERAEWREMIKRKFIDFQLRRWLDILLNTTRTNW